MEPVDRDCPAPGGEESSCIAASGSRDAERNATNPPAMAGGPGAVNPAAAEGVGAGRVPRLVRVVVQRIDDRR